MTGELLAQLIALTLLGGGLCTSLFWRGRAERRKRRAEHDNEITFRKQWNPVAFDVSLIAQQITQVRLNHTAAFKPRPHKANRLRLTQFATEKIMRLAYFSGTRGNKPAARPDEGQPHIA